MIDAIDRIAGPGFEQVGNVEFLPVNVVTLPNGIDVSLLDAGSREVVKIDWVFPAGSVQAGRPLLASTVGNLLTEGTTGRSGPAIAGAIDFHGAHLSAQAFFHNSVVTLVCLTRELPTMLELAADVIRNPSFDQSELEIYLGKRREEFMVESMKVKNIAARRLCEVVFGEDHPYGWQLKLEHFDTITRDEAISFHRETYTPSCCRIIVAGKPGNNIGEMLASRFGDFSWPKGDTSRALAGNITPHPGKNHFIPREGALQSAIRVGRAICNNSNPDFLPLQVINTILGGYFGSRLMTNVREQKGLTYGIGSNLVSYKEHGMWYIASEVDGTKRQAAVDAIFEEMTRLASEPISRDELDTVRNYMLGELLRYFDGPFQTSDIYRTLLEFDLGLSYYEKLALEIKSITPGRIMEMAARYLDPAHFHLVVAGK